MRALPVVLIALVLVASPAVALIPGLDHDRDADPMRGRIPHGPITIESDADFCSNPLKSGVRNCDSADGSAEKPYVISGWSIQSVADAGLPAVTIRDTTKHVLVKDNTFSTPCADTVSTLVIENARHVTVETTTVVGGLSPAVRGLGAGDFTLRSNTLQGACGGLTGIRLVTLVDSHGITLEDNVIGGVDDEDTRLHGGNLLAVADSTTVTLTGNTYHDATGTAVQFTNVDGAVAFDEDVWNVRYGVDVTGSSTVDFTGLTMDRVQDAVQVTDTLSFRLAYADLTDSWPCSPSCLPVGIAITNSEFTGEHLHIRGFNGSAIAVHNETAPATTETCESTEDAYWEECEWTARIRYANITDNRVGVDVSGRAKVYVGYSNIAGNSEYGIHSTSSQNVLGHKDWWGDPDGPTTSKKTTDGDRVTDNVRVASIQSEPYPW